MSIFTPVPNNGMRVLCSICNKQVSLKLKDDHQQYHILGDMALSPTQTLCKECNSPVSIKSFQIHLEGFHNMARTKAHLLKLKAEQELRRRNRAVVEMPKPAFQLPNAVANQIQQRAEERAMQADERKIDENVVQAYRNRVAKLGRPRVIPSLEGESDEQRRLRLNRENVKKFRDKKRAEKGITGPKRAVKKQLQEGETVDDYDRRLHAERMKRYRAKLKEAKK